VDERPLRRASRGMVEALLTEEDMAEADR